MLETKRHVNQVFEIKRTTKLMNGNADKFSDLRKRAEAALQDQPIDVQKLSPEEISHLLHELQLHRLELEIQNEELRSMQQVLEESRNKYSDLYDFAPVGYFTIDEKGVILEANLTGAYLLGRETRTMVNKPFSRFVIPDDRRIYYEHCQQVFRTKSRQFCELRLLKKDGTIFYAQ
jgi:PAS domain S-box-containing protein